jgi:ribosomal protein S18 acetylase RimI-like enzyme
MKLSLEDLRRMERAHVKAWPALETGLVDGWLWRFSGGGSQRANSVSTLDFSGADPVLALEEAQARYRAKSMPARLHTSSVTCPPNLAGILAQRGYAKGETTLTMVKPVGSTPQVTDAEAADVQGTAPKPSATRPGEAEVTRVEATDRATPEWLEVYLGVITQDRRAINAKILETVPHPRAFFAYRHAGRVISTALGVADEGCAVIECVATRVDSRGRGRAKIVLRALEAWACRQGVSLLGLQVSETNAPALALYRRLGFTAVERNCFWVSG